MTETNNLLNTAMPRPANRTLSAVINYQSAHKMALVLETVEGLFYEVKLLK
jgi:hypothetical protein